MRAWMTLFDRMDLLPTIDREQIMIELGAWLAGFGALLLLKLLREPR